MLLCYYNIYYIRLEKEKLNKMYFIHLQWLQVLLMILKCLKHNEEHSEYTGLGELWKPRKSKRGKCEGFNPQHSELNICTLGRDIFYVLKILFLIHTSVLRKIHQKLYNRTNL